MERDLIALNAVRDRLRRVLDARDRQHKAGRIRWLVDFLRRDFAAPMREGERLDLSDDVLAFLDTTYVGINRDLTTHELADIRAATLFGLKSWLSERTGWPLGRYEVDIVLGGLSGPPPSTAVHNGLVFRAWERPRISYSIPEESLADVKHAFVLAAAQTVVAEGDRLKRCLWCADFFISVRRQRYCSKVCTQEAMDARKPGREKLPRYMRTSTVEPERPAVPEQPQDRPRSASKTGRAAKKSRSAASARRTRRRSH